MELIYYLRIVARRWPFAIIGLLITMALTVAFLQRQPLVYQSTATVVVRPRTVDSEASVRAIETLTRGVEISSTYATIARSELIRDRARQRLDPSLDTSGTHVSSEVVTSTNILEISVSGRDPGVVAALASEVTRQTVAYVSELQNVYELEVVDSAREPNRPVAPNRPLILGAGLVIGLGVAIVFAALAEAAARPAYERRMRRHMTKRIRQGDRGAYDGRDFRSRESLADATPGRSTTSTTNGGHTDAAGVQGISRRRRGAGGVRG